MITAWLLERLADQLGRASEVTGELAEHLRIVACLLRATP